MFVVPKSSKTAKIMLRKSILVVVWTLTSEETAIFRFFNQITHCNQLGTVLFLFSQVIEDLNTKQ